MKKPFGDVYIRLDTLPQRDGPILIIFGTLYAEGPRFKMHASIFPLVRS